MSLNVVPFPEGPKLDDVVGQIRNFADRVEAGEFGEVGTIFAVMPRAGDYPTLFGWGDTFGGNDPVIQFEMAKIWLITHMTKRE